MKVKRLSEKKSNIEKFKQEAEQWELLDTDGNTDKSLYDRPARSNKSTDEHEESIEQPLANLENDKTKRVILDSDSDENKTKKKVKLFNNDAKEQISLSDHFKEKKEDVQKLFKSQTRMSTNDQYDKSPEEFLQKNNDNNEKNNDEITVNDDEKDFSLEDEKKRALSILDRMTIKQQTAEKLKRTEQVKMVRFDPTKTEHRIYEIESNLPTKKIQNDIETKSILRSPKTTANSLNTIETESIRTHTCDASKLKSMFNKSVQNKDNFQFNFLNNSQVSSSSSPMASFVDIEQPLSFSRSKSKGKHIFGAEHMSNDDETHIENENENENDEKLSTKDNDGVKRTFFFFDIDSRLKEGLESFVRTDDLNELERNWPTKRKEIAEALRTKHRKAMQWQDKRRINKYRHRSLKNQMYLKNENTT